MDVFQSYVKYGMTDRRSFFKSLALLATGASLSPHIFIPKFEPVKWKVVKVESPLPYDFRRYLGEWKFVTEPIVWPYGMGETMRPIGWEHSEKHYVAI